MEDTVDYVTVGLSVCADVFSGSIVSFCSSHLTVFLASATLRMCVFLRPLSSGKMTPRDTDPSQDVP